MITWIGILLVGFATLASWRMSRVISCALGVAFVASCAYELLRQYAPDTWLGGSLEHLRLVSLVVGSAGVWELMTRAHRRSLSKNEAVAIAWEEGFADLANVPWVERWIARLKREQIQRYAFCRVDLLALACVASCAVDFVACAGFYHGLAWSLPYVQSGVCAGMIGLCAWPRKEGST